MSPATFIIALFTIGFQGSPSQAASEDALPLATVVAEQRARIEMIKKVTPAVVCLFPKETMSGGGSGVIIDEEGYGLTNFHVVAAMLEKREADAGLPDHKKHDAQVLGIDPHGDLAMFRVMHKRPAPFVEMGDSDVLQVGDNCLALGNPFLLADDFSPTATFGIISGLHRYQWGAGRALSYTDCIQVDSSINPGNSGGPLFDMTGKLVGINGRVSIEERGRVNVGVGYAITINQIRRFIPALRAGLVAPHAAAGFTVLDAGNHVIVNQILPDSAAYRAGLRVNDKVLRFGGVDIRNANQFLSLLGTFPARWPVELVFKNDGRTTRARLRLDELPLPEVRGGHAHAGQKKFDPFAQTPETQTANRRAVRRAIEMYAQALGGRDAVAGLKALTFVGSRRASDKPQDPPRDVNFNEDSTKPGDLESTVRWQLFRDVNVAEEARGKVVRADEVRGRIAVVIEKTISIPIAAKEPAAPASSQANDDAKDGTARLKCFVSFDDADGRLLAIEFTDPADKKRHRYEYADEKRFGPFKLPTRRWCFMDDQPVYEDAYEKIEVAGD